MAGYWPSSFSACLWIEQACSIKDLLYGFRGNFSCGTNIYHLLTESEVITGKSQTEALMY